MHDLLRDEVFKTSEEKRALDDSKMVPTITRLMYVVNVLQDKAQFRQSEHGISLEMQRYDWQDWVTTGIPPSQRPSKEQLDPKPDQEGTGVPIAEWKPYGPYGLHAGGSFVLAAENSQRQAILATLREIGAPASPKEIATVAQLKKVDVLAQLKTVDVRQLLVKMLKAGEVQKERYGKYTIIPVTPGTPVTLDETRRIAAGIAVRQHVYDLLSGKIPDNSYCVWLTAEARSPLLTRPIQSWRDYAPDLEQIFRSEPWPNPPKDFDSIVFRFIECVTPAITGEEPTFAAVSSELSLRSEGPRWRKR
jgi:hypothetical protein